MTETARIDMDLVKNELESIRTKHGGILHPAAVIEFASDEDTELHKRFEWDDAKAGHSYRLWQARQLIKVVVERSEVNGNAVEIPVYVSLSADRKDGGYRSVREVYAEDELRRTLLADAKRELDRFKSKYKVLVELQEVFAAIDRVA